MTEPQTSAVPPTEASLEAEQEARPAGLSLEHKLAMMRQICAGMQALAWMYVAARVMHAYIHLGGNRLRWRIRFYFLSWIVLLTMWICLVVGTY